MADKGDFDLIRICSLIVQKMSLWNTVAGEISAVKVDDRTHGSNPSARCGTRAHHCAVQLNLLLTHFSRDWPARHWIHPSCMYEHTSQIITDCQPGSSVWLPVHKALNLVFVGAVTMVVLQAVVTKGNTDYGCQVQLHCTCPAVVFRLLHVNASVRLTNVHGTSEHICITKPVS